MQQNYSLKLQNKISFSSFLLRRGRQYLTSWPKGRGQRVCDESTYTDMMMGISKIVKTFVTSSMGDPKKLKWIYRDSDEANRVCFLRPNHSISYGWEGKIIIKLVTDQV